MLRNALAGDRRPPDGMLHPSSDLTGPMRHVMLSAAGAPTAESETASDVRLMIGTLLHSYMEGIFRGKPAMLEVKLDKWLPQGWSGTCDWLVWNHERRAFVLGDLKSIRADGLIYIQTDGIKREHLHQVSLYWHGARNMGLPLLKGFGVYYLPKEPIIGQKIEPMWVEGTPLPYDYIWPLAEERRLAVDAYLEELRAPRPKAGVVPFVNDSLAPTSDKELRLMWNGTAIKRKGKAAPAWELKWMPIWQTTYCPFPNELCDCSEQRPEKVGHWSFDEDGISRFTLSRGKSLDGRAVIPMSKAQEARLLKAHTTATKEA